MSTQSQGASIEDSNVLRKRKRQQTAIACGRCRERKIKCSGERPCKACISRSEICSYDANPGESRREAHIRATGTLEQERDNLLELVHILSQRRDAAEILQRVHNASDASQVLSQLRGDGVIPQQTAVRSNWTYEREMLSTLLRSKSSLPEIILHLGQSGGHATSSNDSGSRRTIAQGPARASLVESASELTSYSTGSLNSPDLTGEHQIRANTEPATTQSLMSAGSWTHVAGNDHFVEHLVSIFLLNLNGFWRFVEEDLFVRDMRSGSKDAQYCSSFLINSICSLAALSSDHPDALESAGDLVSRGQSFHQEAMRLWLLEEGRPSLINLQALAILTLACCSRGKDMMGLAFLTISLKMSSALPMDSTDLSAEALRDFSRARICIAWAIHYFDISAGVIGMGTPCPIDSRLSLVPNPLDINQPISTSDPAQGDALMRSDRLMREKCVLARMLSELTGLMSAHTRVSWGLKSLQSRLSDWYELLPADIQYNSNLLGPLYELHAGYHCAMLKIATLLEQLPQSHNPAALADKQRPGIRQHALSDGIGPHSDSKCLPEILKYACNLSSILRDYREQHGLMTCLSWLAIAQADSCLALVTWLSQIPTLSTDAVASTRQLAMDALAESFRCMLGYATQNMISRATARIVVDMASALQIEFPPGLLRILEVEKGVIWDQKDALRLSTSFLNRYLTDAAARSKDSRID